MRLLKIKALSALTTVFGISGAITLIVGSSVCLSGIAATGVIKLGEFLSSGRTTYQKMIYYGSGAVGVGVFFIGATAAIACKGEQLAEEEMRRVDAKLQDHCSSHNCLNCKYYSGESLLPCAVHPELKEDCPDWEEKANNAAAEN